MRDSLVESVETGIDEYCYFEKKKEKKRKEVFRLEFKLIILWIPQVTSKNVIIKNVVIIYPENVREYLKLFYTFIVCFVFGNSKTFSTQYASETGVNSS